MMICKVYFEGLILEKPLSIQVFWGFFFKAQLTACRVYIVTFLPPDGVGNLRFFQNITKPVLPHMPWSFPVQAFDPIVRNQIYVCVKLAGDFHKRGGLIQ